MNKISRARDSPNPPVFVVNISSGGYSEQGG